MAKLRGEQFSITADTRGSDGDGNPGSAAEQLSVAADLTPVPALPLAGAVALAVLLLVGGGRWRAAR